MIKITIEGPPASGKSVLAREVAEMLRMVFRVSPNGEVEAGTRSEICQRRKAVRAKQLFHNITILTVNE